MDDRHRDLGQFHDVGKLFPEDTPLESVTPDATVAQALQVMLENHYSQLPVVEDGHVRGVFSLWSIARHLESSPKVQMHGLAVEDVMESLPTVTVDHSLHDLLSLLDRHEAVLVGSPRVLQAIATPSDVLRYLYGVARPFVLLGEIELALRALISECAPGPKLQECIDRSIARSSQSRGQPIPTKLESMTFEDYKNIVGAKENWPLFEGVLGRNRELVLSKLSGIQRIRNAVFHFRDDVSVVDHQTLAATRDWLLSKSRRMQTSLGGADG